jgi:hypothetical protein
MAAAPPPPPLPGPGDAAARRAFMAFNHLLHSETGAAGEDWAGVS